MNVMLYVCTEDDKVLNKSISQAGQLTSFYLKDNSSLLKPQLIFDYRNTLFDPECGKTANYLYIDQWKRYYFIRDVIYSQQSVILDCEIDPLMTYSSALLEMEMFVARQGKIAYVPEGKEDSEPLGNIYLPDDFMPVQANRDLSMIGDGSEKYGNFERIGKLNDGTFVLLVNGGQTSI